MNARAKTFANPYCWLCVGAATPEKGCLCIRNCRYCCEPVAWEHDDEAPPLHPECAVDIAENEFHASLECLHDAMEMIDEGGTREWQARRRADAMRAHAVAVEALERAESELAESVSP